MLDDIPHRHDVELLVHERRVEDLAREHTVPELLPGVLRRVRRHLDPGDLVEVRRRLEEVAGRAPDVEQAPARDLVG